MPPSKPAERESKPPVRVTPAPIESVPPLPWSPRLEHHLFREPLWLLFVFGTVFTVNDLIQADQVPWWRWASGPIALGLLWNAMKIAFERLTVTEGGLVVRGPLLRRRYSWKALDGVQRRGQKKVTLDLGHRGTKTFEFDGKQGAPTADLVAGVVERLRGYNTSALTSYRVSLSWGAAVFLPAVAAVVAATAWALIEG
ncbi:PH domain-containing protein [Kribbella catacumbae]|uniref:PH domain-containing protein n=1 Tax=Kribbella catacumbae TaxID=460086 RepID=UPI000373FE08|nr:PH domain-containing protein [Kribbella catacumbae]